MLDCAKGGKTEGHSTCEYRDADATLTCHSEEPNISSAATNERGTANSKSHKIVLSRICRRDMKQGKYRLFV